MQRESRLEWWVLADATLAGLAALIPMPGLDVLVEGVFRRRIPRTIARNRRVSVDPGVLRRLGRGGDWLSASGCLILPLLAVVWLVKRLFRKLVYVLTVAEAAGQISEYWHRAFLVDYLVRGGYLGAGDDVERTLQLFAQVLEGADTSPVRGLARQVARSPGRVLRVLGQLRRGEPVSGADQGLLDTGWLAIGGSLEALPVRFEELTAGAGQGSRDVTTSGTGSATTRRPK